MIEGRRGRTATFVLWLGVLGAGCGGAQTGGEPPSAGDPALPPCSPPEAPFAKVMNPSFAREYSNCTVETEAAFNSADWAGMVGGELDGFVKWSALPGDGGGRATAGNPFGAADVKLMYVPKEKSDVLFQLKKGDRVIVKGRAVVSVVGQVMLVASEVTAAGRGP